MCVHALYLGLMGSHSVFDQYRILLDKLPAKSSLVLLDGLGLSRRVIRILVLGLPVLRGDEWVSNSIEEPGTTTLSARESHGFTVIRSHDKGGDADPHRSD